MTVSWNDGYNAELIAQRIEECKSLDATGRVSFSAFEHSEYTVLLYSALQFPDSVPEIEARRIAGKATLNVGGRGAITAQKLLTEINKLINIYLSQPTQTYFLATSLSVDWFTPLPAVQINGVTIYFGPRLPKRYIKGIEGLSVRFKYVLFADIPTDYRPLRARVVARSIHEAAYSALDAIDLVRGIWNWAFNRRHTTRMSFGSRQPVNRISLGPAHTLHKPSGELATDTFWYEQHYRSPIAKQNLRRDIAQLQKFSKIVRSQLQRSQYRHDLENAIIRYARALDDRDWNASFLRLWSILEHLTATTNDSNSVTARRAAFVFEDRDYQLQVLNQLRTHRNRTVHASVNTEEIEAYMYQVKNYVEALLEFHLGNSFRFSSIKEAAGFLDLPVDADALKYRIKVSQYALKYIGYTHTRKGK